MIDIVAGEMRAVLAPDLGGAVLSLRWRDSDVLRPAPSAAAVADDPREAACYPCVPWFGRLYGGLDFDGVHYDLAPTLPACEPDHALHGHGWVTPWAVTEKADDRIVCQFDYAPQPSQFPFAFSASQEFSVSSDRFSIILTLTNTGDSPMPAGLGIHPFFPHNKQTRLNLVERPGKPKQRGALALPDVIDHSGPIPDDPIDYTVRGWNGEAQILHNDMHLNLSSNARLIHLYSPEDADFYCAEPISHKPGYFGEDILAPGETTRLTLALRIS